MATYTYPPAPAGVPESVIQPSAQFRKEVRKVIAALAGFGVLYFLMLLASVFIALCCAVFAFLLVGGVRHWLAIALGIGLLGTGLMVMYFVIKFLFAKKKADQTGHTEIHESDYPDLFSFIRKVSQETGTTFPKHIYLSSEVNAAVFYDSSFWSMIFPVRKNLVIGLGLVNMTNLSEFKAVLAHEFGHFSQKSMRAGSYVYHANKIIYDMLYENEGYGAALQRFANVHFTFALCAKITVSLIRSIQWVLQQSYATVNKQYMSLSRQMEFHADAVATKAAGSNNAIHALRRVEFADTCYGSVIAHYNEWIPSNLKGRNLYSQQRIVAGFIANDYGFPLKAGLPVLQEVDRHFKSYHRVTVDDQWASHPTRLQREEAMAQLAIDGIVVEESAWVLFPDADTLQERVTSEIYANVTFNADPSTVSDDQFSAKYGGQRREFSYPSFYDGYYNGRPISTFDPESSDQSVTPVHDISGFFKAHKDLHAKLEAAREDAQLLQHISNKANDIRSFDFEGNKYHRSDAGLVKATLEKEIEAMEAAFISNDQTVYHFFIDAAGRHSKAAENLKVLYKKYFELQPVAADNINACNHIMELIYPFYNEETLEGARRMNGELQEATRAFAGRLGRVKEILKTNPLTKDCTLPENLTKCREKHWRFMDSSNQILGDELQALQDHVQLFGNWTFEMNFVAQRTLLQFQASMKPAPEMA